MNQAAHQALTMMLNAFPQGGQDYRLLLLTFEEDLTGISNQAIVEAAQRYRRNEIPGQNETFAPSVAEFVTAARRQEEYISIRNRPRIAGPPIRPLPQSAPVQRRTDAERARATKLMSQFNAVVDREKDAKLAAERAEIRARYGMTDEVLAAMKDQPLPEGMAQVGDIKAAQ